ncbi:c-type cytochrome [Xinfangfangia sp. CPCC 101601]|uniref:C-type cytochrome n=1 Tax=Pseudogemmobacter lacusdianii TaxID=3069608 RepID=A0ABU0VVG9_9RHOB|nr:c-type cytochrome [Xinfangfangia sp. CPCC 101601]MDQ2064965.1 c-type cytochrome [Xinfangfangia sp. CPCC 101601]
MRAALKLPAALAACLALSACVEEAQPSGAEDFASYCASCHGVGGKGDGELASALEKRPADLTTLTQRNKGEFPRLRMMAKIWGYTGTHDGGAVMPNFGPLLESRMVPYDAGDGIQSPTPERLVQLAEYVEGLQL